MISQSWDKRPIIFASLAHEPDLMDHHNIRIEARASEGTTMLLGNDPLAVLGRTFSRRSGSGVKTGTRGAPGEQWVRPQHDIFLGAATAYGLILRSRSSSSYWRAFHRKRSDARMRIGVLLILSVDIENAVLG